MQISFIRGAYLNNFEGQNYDLPIHGYSSFCPIDFHVPFSVTKLPSIADLQKISFLNKPIKYITNRTMGDSQILFGLEQYITGSDIVHVGDPHYYYSYQTAILKSQGKIKKLVSTWWETIPFNNEGTKAKKRIKQFVMSQVDQYLCHTEKAQSCLLSEGVQKENISLIPLGVDLRRFFPLKQKKDHPFTILFVGRLVKEKGILDLYESFKMFFKENRNTKLRIVGDGPFKHIVMQRIDADKLKHIVSIEQKNYEEMPVVYQSADVLCVPSKKTNTWEEQYGMVFVEAMASGLPVVSYNTGAIVDVVGEAGVFVEEGNREMLVQSFKRLYSDEKLWTKLGTMGRERAEKLFDARKTKDEIVHLYKTLNPGL